MMDVFWKWVAESYFHLTGVHNCAHAYITEYVRIIMCEKDCSVVCRDWVDLGEYLEEEIK